MPRFSDLLVSEGLLSRPQVEEALEAQALYGGGLDTCILELGLCDESRLEPLLVRAWGLPNHIDWRSSVPSEEALALVPPADAAHWRIVPFRVERRVLDILTADPNNLRLLDEIAFKTGHRVRASIATEVRIAVLLEQYYRVPRPVRFQDIARGAILRPRAEGRDATSARGPEAAHPNDPYASLVTDDGVAMPSIAALDVVDRATLAVIPQNGGQAARTDRHGLMPPRSALPTSEMAAAPVPMALAPRPTPSLPATRRANYAPEHFDASLADFRDDKEVTTGVRQLNDKLRALNDRDALPLLIFPFLSPHVRRMAVFSVRKNLCFGWEATGLSVDPQRIRTMVFPLAHPSIFKEAAEGDVFVGSMPLTNVNEEFARRMGEPRMHQVIVTPIRIRDKVVTLIACDCESERALEKAFLPVVETADKLARTFVRLILDRKRLS